MLSFEDHLFEQMLNSDLTQVLHKEKIDVTIAYAGNPCQMAIAHVIGSPVIYFDTQGFDNMLDKGYFET